MNLKQSLGMSTDLLIAKFHYIKGLQCLFLSGLDFFLKIQSFVDLYTKESSLLRLFYELVVD